MCPSPEVATPTIRGVRLTALEQQLVALLRESRECIEDLLLSVNMSSHWYEDVTTNVAPAMLVNLDAMLGAVRPSAEHLRAT